VEVSAHAGEAHLARHRSETRRLTVGRWHASCAVGGMHAHLHQDVLEHAIHFVSLARPLVEAVARRDRDLASQLRRALNSVVLNLAEGLGSEAGNARARFESARGSLYEALAGLRLAVAWGYASEGNAQAALESAQALGARVFGLARH
jgi:four helix bundle protein